MYTKTRLGKIVNLVRLGIEISLILSISILSMYASCLAGQEKIALVNPVWKGILKQTWPEVRARGTFQACEETVSSYDEFMLALIRAMRARQNVTIYFDPNKSYNECIKWNDRFWGPSSSSEPTDSDLFQKIPWLYWTWTNLDWDWFYDEQGFVTRIIYNISYRYGSDEEKALERELVRTLEQIVFPDMDMFTREKTIHDWIVNYVDIDVATLNGSDDLGYTDYSALIRGLAVCAGYSTLAYRMLSMVGIRNLIVYGNVPTSHHAWNMVKLCGNWYHLDVMWDDRGHCGDYTVHYDYFNLSDGQISANHTWDRDSYPIANRIFNESVCWEKIEHRCSIFEPELCDTELKCIRISSNWCGTYCETVSYPMVISPSELEVDIGATKTATATGGTVPYTVISSDFSIATATVSDDTIIIKGVAEGNCTITVKDSSSPAQTAEITVHVTADGEGAVPLVPLEGIILNPDGPFINPVDTPINVSPGIVSIAPQMKVSDCNNVATPLMYVYLHDYNVGVDLSPWVNEACYNGIATFDIGEIDLSDYLGLVFDVYYGYLDRSDNIIYNAYEVTVTEVPLPPL